MIVAIHNQPYPIKQIIALQPSHAYISSFAQILGPLGWCEDGEAHAGIAVCPFGLFFRGSGIAMHADGIYMRRRVDAIRIEEPAMQLKPIAAEKIHPAVSFLLECFWCYQILAARSLSVESKKVYHALKTQDVEGARKAVSMIVGRDTKSLTEEGIAKAAVETVAENTSDGVTAPLMFLMLGGAPLGFLYKAVNTMDSMLGYKNEKNLYFGRVAAKMDDVFNYLPSRVSAVLMIAAAFLTGMDAKKAAQIYKRDRRKHASPNSAQTESVCAGALQVQLAGDAWYFGVLHKKETIGDPIRPVEAEDIKRAGRLMYVTAVLTLLFAGMIRFWYFW